MKKELNLHKLVNFLAFVAIVAIAVALVFGKIFPTIAGALTIIANAIAYIVTAIAAFYYIKPKKNIWYLVTYIVACVLVVVFMILK